MDACAAGWLPAAVQFLVANLVGHARTRFQGFRGAMAATNAAAVCTPHAQPEVCQPRPPTSADSSMGRARGKALTKDRNRGRPTTPKKPSWDFEAPPLARSMRADTVRLDAFSRSPCRG